MLISETRKRLENLPNQWLNLEPNLARIQQRDIYFRTMTGLLYRVQDLVTRLFEYLWPNDIQESVTDKRILEPRNSKMLDHQDSHRLAMTVTILYLGVSCLLVYAIFGDNRRQFNPPMHTNFYFTKIVLLDFLSFLGIQLI